MSVFDSPRSPLSEPSLSANTVFMNEGGDDAENATLMDEDREDDNVTLMGDGGDEEASPLLGEDGNDGLQAPDGIPRGLDAYRNAREIVRLLQCQFCSLPLRQPVILPCGNGLCRQCLPESYKREKITYPMLPDRQEAFLCPFEDCRQEHVVGDCSNDVTLAKVLDRVSQELDKYRQATGDTPTKLDEKLHWRHIMDGSKSKLHNSRTLHGGRLLSTFTMAEVGELQYDSSLNYQSLSPTGDTYGHLDLALLEHLKEVARNQMECEVCYGLMLDPLTTHCGHTFCRKCVARVLDHSASCPICRRDLKITPGVVQEPSNKYLSKILEELCPDLVAARTNSLKAEESAFSEGDSRIPIFVCTLSYPQMPTFLHIFEPRYRLMVRRAMESNRQFGMVAYNGQSEPQGTLGNTQFVQYGTMLYIRSMQLLQDGRSLLETRGLYRFKVINYTHLDGYVVGRVERVVDIPLAEEEAFEAAEVSTQHPPDPGSRSGEEPLASTSTADLMRLCTDFVGRMRVASAPWLSQTVLEAYGNMPEDPAVFPFWFAAVVPIAETEKYRLLPTRSVRERLKITAGWVRRVQGMRFTSNSCTVL